MHLYVRSARSSESGVGELDRAGSGRVRDGDGDGDGALPSHNHPPACLHSDRRVDVRNKVRTLLLIQSVRTQDTDYYCRETKRQK